MHMGPADAGGPEMGAMCQDAVSLMMPDGTEMPGPVMEAMVDRCTVTVLAPAITLVSVDITGTSGVLKWFVIVATFRCIRSFSFSHLVKFIVDIVQDHVQMSPGHVFIIMHVCCI